MLVTADTLTGWKCVRFGVNQPVYFQYKYTRGGSPIAPQSKAGCTNGGICYEAGAKGNLDGNAPPFWVFARTGHVNTTSGKLKANTQIFEGGAGAGCQLSKYTGHADLNDDKRLAFFSLLALSLLRRRQKPSTHPC